MRWLVLHGGDVAVGGAGDFGFGVTVHDAAEAVVHAVIGEGFRRGDDFADLRGPQRYVVGLAIHERHPAGVGDHVHGIGGEQHATAFRTIAPVQERGAFEMPSAVDGRHAVDDGL